MSLDFLQSLGFTSDPFASTNAADEPLIGQYFVEPPFFPAVIGDPKFPKSNIVFAPRGGGKTAQKIMIEQKSKHNDDFLCITYDKFQTDGLKSNANFDSEYHLNNITRILFVACLVLIEDGKINSEGLSAFEKRLLVSLSKEFIGNISAERFREALDSVKTFGDKAKDLWQKHGSAIVSVVNAVIAKFDAGKIEIEHKDLKILDETIRFKFESLVSIITGSGYKSLYILIDRVDELTFTANDAGKAFSFLKNLLIDLPLLETSGVAFKFFLWDQVKEYYQDAGGRPDRLLEYTLDWSATELEKVLGRRISTYSNGKLKRFDDLLVGDSTFNVHRMLAHFAHSSPRDLIRICKKIIDEHTRAGVSNGKISFRTVKSALLSFCAERARELYGSQVTELKKVHDLNFTVNVLANDVFRISGQAARSKVQKWQDSGAVVKIGDVPNPGNRPQYLYGITDPRLALSVMSDSSVEEAMEGYLLLCPHCRNLRIAYEGEITCPDCQGNFHAEEAVTLAQYCVSSTSND